MALLNNTSDKVNGLFQGELTDQYKSVDERQNFCAWSAESPCHGHNESAPGFRNANYTLTSADVRTTFKTGPAWLFRT